MSRSSQNPVSWPSHAQVAPLDTFTVVRVAGADAVSFLHSQLTQDVSGLAVGQARLAAYCNAKGRVQASMVLWRGNAEPEAGDTLWMLLAADLADALVKRLRMFVLRAKVTLQRMPWRVYGLRGELPTPEGLPEPWQAVLDPNTSHWWLGAPALPGHYRAWLLTPEPLTDVVMDLAPADWHHDDIALGLPWITQATFELFTPLTLNLDLIDGVSFSKGCYPGQEVVARSHYRGKQKRRMLRAVGTAASSEIAASLPGTDICSPAAREPIGRVINATVTGSTLAILFEAPVQDIETQALHLSTGPEHTLTLAPLPYSVAAEPG